MKPKFQLCLALLVAGLFSDVTSCQGWHRIWKAAALWWGGLKEGARVPEDVARRRLGVCLGCPIFYRPLGTCGSPLRADLRDQGCWCHMPTAVKFKEKQCFLDETLAEDAPCGWHMYGL